MFLIVQSDVLIQLEFYIVVVKCIVNFVDIKKIEIRELLLFLDI